MSPKPNELKAGSPAGAEVIFPDDDVACLHCGYDLRGLVESRCPECGEAFDPVEAWRAYVRRRLAPPNVWWVIARILRRPGGFWNLPEAREGAPPTLKQVAILVSLAAGGAAGLGYVHAARRDGFDLLVGGAVVSLILIIAALMHMVFCLPVFPRREHGDEDLQILAAVGWPLAWAIPAAPLAVEALHQYYLWCGMTTIPSLWDRLRFHLAWAALIAAFTLWAISLYRGAMARSDGSRFFAIGCTLLNPFFIVLPVAWLLTR
jgi:hypothetical protein